MIFILKGSVNPVIPGFFSCVCLLFNFRALCLFRVKIYLLQEARISAIIAVIVSFKCLVTASYLCSSVISALTMSLA